jgi:hypothetical protein
MPVRTIVLDTNVLLSDPESLYAFPGSEIVVPETVLGELDKVKTGRVDPDLRYRGREVSRALFELSLDGDLVDGVPLPGEGQLRVVPLDPGFDTPDGLSMRNADDRIIATALQVCDAGCDDLTLVTNDLNMLLKAQTLGIRVARHDDGPDSTFARRYIIRPFQRYKVPLGILAMALAVFGAIVVLTLLTRGDVGSSGSGVPSEFRTVLSEQQERILDLSLRLEENPTDLDAVLNLANEYYDLSEHTGDTQMADLARRYYEQYLQSRPDDPNVRTDLAISYFVLGNTDRAIQEVTTVLQSDPDHLNAAYNLGIFYWRGRRDYQRAAAQFQSVIDLTQGSTDPNAQTVNELAANSLSLVIEEAEAAGQPIDATEGSS